ncbi:MAG: hypothetical protein K2F74_06965, partial [Muribaculaceae bacterium]|nr:hypothetical protein [Muribaculaceae bacterium]
RHLVIILLLILSVVSYSSPTGDQSDDNIRIYQDSIPGIIVCKDFLYFVTGYHGHNWAYVVSDEEGYIAVSGDTRTGDFRIDIISKDATRLKWGLDSLALYCHEMKPLKRTIYRMNYERLALVSSNKEIIFDCVDTDYFSGPDSVTFNKELSKLKYMMLWIAFPIEYKDELPSPL